MGTGFLIGCKSLPHSLPPSLSPSKERPTDAASSFHSHSFLMHSQITTKANVQTDTRRRNSRHVRLLRNGLGLRLCDRFRGEFPFLITSLLCLLQRKRLTRFGMILKKTLAGARHHLLRPPLPGLHLVRPFVHSLRADVCQEPLQQDLLRRGRSCCLRCTPCFFSSPSAFFLFLASLLHCIIASLHMGQKQGTLEYRAASRSISRIYATRRELPLRCPNRASDER